MLKNLNKILKDLSSKFRRNYKVIFLNVASLVGIILLGINIYRVLSIGIQRYALISMEEQDLDQVKREEKVLENELKFYSSLDFIESKSRDYLCLAHEGDLILVIPDTDKEEKVEIPIEFGMHESKEPSIDLWIKLLF